MLGKWVESVSGILVLLVSVLAASGAMAEEVQDPTGTVCASVNEETECDHVAVAKGGDASCEGDSGSVLPRSECVAVSDEGEARCEGLCLAASGTGPAAGFLAASGSGDANGTVAATATGHAEGLVLAVSGLGNADSFIAAVSLTGDAETEFVRLLAASGTGNTSADYVEANGMNDADGCVAVSGTGSAEASCRNSRTGHAYEASGCETGQEAADRDEACRSPDEREEVADVIVCDTDLSTADGQGHAWCGHRVGECIQVIWGIAAGPLFVGGYDGCQAGAFYEDDGHTHGLQP